MRTATVLLATLLLAACQGPAARPDAPATVAQVDLDRYAGHWYEIARLPNRFQSRCIADTTARYTHNADGSIAVVNRCRIADGRFDEARAVARVADADSNAKLEVSFFRVLGWRPLWGDYWILMLDPDYGYAVVGEPSRRYGWILSRTPGLPAATRARIDDRLRALGYDPRRFADTAHAAP